MMCTSSSSLLPSSLPNWRYLSWQQQREETERLVAGLHPLALLYTHTHTLETDPQLELWAAPWRWRWWRTRHGFNYAQGHAHILCTWHTLTLVCGSLRRSVGLERLPRRLICRRKLKFSFLFWRESTLTLRKDATSLCLFFFSHTLAAVVFV